MTGRAAGTDWLRRATKNVGAGAPLVVPEDVAETVRIEAWLKKHGVEYAPPMMIAMSAIDVRKSRDNQARKDPIVPESVDRYAVAFRQGDQFPPIVGYPVGGKFVIIDGNNRQEAARKAGLTEIAAIMISAQTPGEMIQLLTIEANARHGVTPDQGWRIKQAFQLCGLGYSDTQAAEATGLSVNTIRAARQVREGEQRAKSLKISGFDNLPASMKQVLQGGCKDDPVFFQAAKTAITTDMKTDEVKLMLKEVKAGKSEGERIEIIGRIAKDRSIIAAQIAVTGKTVRNFSPKTNLVTGLGKVRATSPSIIASQLRTTQDKADLLKAVLAGQDHLLELQIALEARTDLTDEEDE